jgi:hypothetical protein
MVATAVHGQGAVIEHSTQRVEGMNLYTTGAGGRKEADRVLQV